MKKLRIYLVQPIVLLLAVLFVYFNSITPTMHIPETIQKEATIALEHFPSLKDVPIHFKFKKNIKKSVMMAQPTFGSFFRSKKKRGYVILISEKFKINNQEFKTIYVPKDVLIGWLGHELGHIMDYQQLNNWEMLIFGIRYVLFKEHIKSAERNADLFAVKNGMAAYILKTKHFILDNADIDPLYKQRIKEFYLSPEEIRELVKETGE
ncbi:hypothetical protein [Croceivirga sp. JEA036]|uniref:hypothetical protein n=1 Tax=Croceivirga sp. JEA036 TaxID=2721162 RepID=UPI001FD7B41E|nr:hypothetical protein [Croceivirga sp. JEA036]